jgi:radical SAM protein with 4Fe4S-binding SPASM domain
LVEEIKDTTLLFALQNWGEPTLVKDLPKIIRYTTDAGIFTRLSTNFSIDYTDEYFEEFMKSGLGRLVIDIDGTTQEVYEKYRVKGNLDLVLNNTKRAVKFKKENNLRYPIIQARMLVMSHNEHQIEDFKKLSKELEVDEMELGNIQLNPNSAKEWLPSNKDYVYNTYLGERVTTPCHWPWSGLVINSDGGVSSCAIVDDQNSDFGNVFENDIMEIWNNEYYQSARTTWSKGKKGSKTTICNICKNDTHNKQLLRVGNTFSLTLNRNVTFSKQQKIEKSKIKKF